MAATNPVRTVMPSLVQIASGWPASDEGWTTQRRIRATTGSEGCGQVMGEFNLEQDTGRVVEPNGTRVEQIGIAPAINLDGGWKSLKGKWVRILLASAAGTGTVSVGGLTYDPLWHGSVDRPVHSPDGAAIVGGASRWQCVGLADALNRIYIIRGYEWHNEHLVDPGMCPVFNDLPGGDRSAEMHEVNGIDVFVFERGALSSGTGARVPWTAKTCIDHVLAAFARGALYGDGATSPTGPKWELGAGADLLDWEIDRLDMSGRTVAELLNTLATPSRGLTWRTKVVGDTVQIIVTSTNRDDVTIIVNTTTPSGPTSTEVTIPAATAVVDNLVGDLWLDNPGIQEESDYYDWITLQAARPWVAITLWWIKDNPNSSLIPHGWEPTDSPGSTPDTEHIWRRWKLNPTWVGEQYPSGSGVGLRHTMPYDATGASGARTFGGPTPPPSALEITRQLPYAQGFSTAVDGPRQSPLVMVGVGASWVDLSKEIDVTPGENPAGIVLGPDEDVARYLKRQLSAGTRTLLVTVGVREWAPFTVAWRRQGEKPRDLPRILGRKITDCEQWVGLQGTVKGVNNGSLQTVSAQEAIRDDAAKAAGALALLTARYGGEGCSYAYGIDGLIDTSEGSAPGTFVSDAQLGGMLLPVNALMTRRGWDLRFENYGTTYRFERLPLDQQSRP